MWAVPVSCMRSTSMAWSPDGSQSDVAARATATTAGRSVTATAAASSHPVQGLLGADRPPPADVEVTPG